jgi:hypothetical protein
MTTRTQQSIVRPRVSRRDISEALAGKPSGDFEVDRQMAAVRCRARLLRAIPQSLQTLLVFSGSEGLLLVPYHPDPLHVVDCVLAPRQLAMATWLGIVQAPPLTVPQRNNASPSAQDAASPRTVLQETVLGGSEVRQALSLEVRFPGEPGWQLLCVTDTTTRWGFGPVDQSVVLQHGGLLGLWSLLRQVAIIPRLQTTGTRSTSVHSDPADVLGDTTACESLIPSDRNQNQVGGLK